MYIFSRKSKNFLRSNNASFINSSEFNSGRSKGRPRRRFPPPYGQKCSQFHAVFWEKVTKSYVGAASYREPWIRRCLTLEYMCE